MTEPCTHTYREPITVMADGTIKQVNPLNGTQVWTVPGRGHRPLGIESPKPKPVAPGAREALCAFCSDRYEETPPEKARLVRAGQEWVTLTDLPANKLHTTTAAFRRIPNLFEIVGYEYWRANYGVEPSPQAQQRRDEYLSSISGRRHVLDIAARRFRACGGTQTDWNDLSDQERQALCAGFFAGGHDVVVARRHLTDGATTDDALASSGTLTYEEHRQYWRFTIEAMAALYAEIPLARYVVTFQNWLKPAGASFDHLHKQLVAIDEYGAQIDAELPKAQADSDLYNAVALERAARHGLLLAENEHAVAFAGFGHRYPTLEVYSRSARGRPWEQALAEQNGMSDLVHALHAATGARIPCNEEWQHQPPGCDTPMPWRIHIKWRVSTLAGFEGGSRIYLNTIGPWSLRDRVLPRLAKLRDAGVIPHDLAIGPDCPGEPLRYGRT